MTQSEMLLWNLIEERLTPGAPVEEIDRRISALFEEEWCVVFTDMAGVSVETPRGGIIPYLCLVHEMKRLVRPVLESHGGLVVKTVADSFLAVFRRAHDAVDALFQAQRALASYNSGRPLEEQILVGAGVGFGRVLKIGGEDVFGLEVSHACRLGEDLAGPGEILVTDCARAALVHSRGLRFTPLDVGTAFAAFRAEPDPAGR